MKNPLSDLHQVKAEEALKKETLSYIIKRQQQHHPVRYPGLVLACACVLCFFIFQALPANIKTIPTETKQVYAYVTLDINPSMELHLDKENQVIDTKAYNADGEALLAQVSLLHKSLEECVGILTANEQFQRYMDDGYLQVSVYSEDEAHSLVLEKQLDAVLAHHYTQEQYSCSCASKKDHEQGELHHMSSGRYQMIESILQINDAYQMDELQLKSMKELREIYEQITGIDESDTRQNNHHGIHHEE